MQSNNNLIFKVLKCQPDALGIGAEAKYTLLILLDYWNPKSHGTEVRPGFPRLSQQTGIPERTLRRHIRQLESAELIKTRRQRNASNRYTINTAIIARLCADAPSLTRTGPESGPIETEAPRQREMAHISVIAGRLKARN